MRVKLIDIDPHFNLEIDGSEAWLAGIYANFPYTGEGSPPKLTGNVDLENVADGNAVRAKGALEYAPMVACDRCTDPLIWPLRVAFDIYFQPEPEAAGKTTSLRASELEQYYYKDNDQIDVEELINDQLHMNLPSRITCELQTGTKCLPELDKNLAEEKSVENPFAILADLKIEDN